VFYHANDRSTGIGDTLGCIANGTCGDVDSEERLHDLCNPPTGAAMNLVELLV
jgi:hypothetical protein